MTFRKGSRLPDAVQDFLDREGLSGRPILVAVSGGPDSTALLDVLREIGPVAAAHLNHQLRGAESDADEQFVTSLCQRLGVTLHVERRNVAEEAARSHRNLEAHARSVRYQWLAETARRHGISLVATGHTLNDQAETVLFHVLRGTGLRGLRGIAARRNLAEGVEVIRPMLRVRRSEVLAYLQKRGLPYREDSSNRDPRFTRTWLRHELLPFVERGFPGDPVAALGRLAEESRQLLRDQQKRVEACLAKAEKPRAGEVIVLDVAELKQLTPTDLGELFCQIWDREHWPRGRLSQRHVQSLTRLLDRTEGTVHLPDGVVARRRGAVLQLFRRTV
ncbi:MAG: tRNA lysidine(34) synthetase TilS [Gemmatales bacterium]|nr:tRNA lysidine(34) synthetase TilS [Gemmatales bacterium]MDW8385878.1 tRNA lysidine(34) synthetase TilS [Gemmatales bacterium]